MPVQAAARDIGRQILVLNASSEHDIDTVFATLAQQHVDALLIERIVCEPSRSFGRTGGATKFELVINLD